MTFSALGHARPVTVAPVLVVCLVLLSGCTGAGQATGEAPGDAWERVRGPQPGWIQNVFPPPGSRAAPVKQVEITHTVVQPLHGVRLVIDGVDVTAFSQTDPGVLTYDPNRPRAPVELGPGTHRVTVARVRLDDEGQVHEVVGRYGWEFTVQ